MIEQSGMSWCLGGLRIAESFDMVDQIEDWSGCRSRARAERRRKRGFPQRVVTRWVPKKDGLMINGVLYVHPEMARQLRSRTGAQP
jgi:hypothetical protein